MRQQLSPKMKPVDSFSEDVESAVKKEIAQFIIAMGYFNAKVGEKQVAKRSAGNFWVGSRNSREDGNKLWFMNAFFYKWNNK